MSNNCNTARRPAHTTTLIASEPPARCCLNVRSLSTASSDCLWRPLNAAPQSLQQVRSRTTPTPKTKVYACELRLDHHGHHSTWNPRARRRVWLVHSAQVDRPNLSEWTGWIAVFLQKSGTFECVRTIRRAMQETCGWQFKSLSDAAIKAKGVKHILEATIEIQSPGTTLIRKSILTASQEALAGPKLHSLGVESSKV
jgi:hypothetical protein